MINEIFNWIGMKIYDKSESFRNTIFGIYYKEVLSSHIEKELQLTNENILLKNKLAKYLESQESEIIPDKKSESKPKSKTRSKKKKE